MRRAWLIRLWRGWAADLAVATAVGVFLGFVGPFGSYFNGPVWVRVAYWLTSVWVGTLVFGSAVRIILGRRWASIPTGFAIVGAVLALAVPFAGLVAVAAPTVWPFLSGFSFWDWYRQVIVITTPLSLGYALLDRARGRGGPDGALPPADGLLGVRPAEVLCLSMEDHYVRVHTATGSKLVLATLAQAISALGGAAGLQTHRSWWVAEKAVARAVAEGRNVRLVLSNGVTAPVARTAVTAVRAAGWLDRPAPPQ